MRKTIPARPGWGLVWHQAGRVLAAQAINVRQGLAALGVATVTNVFSGITLGFMVGTLEELPGLIILVPAAIGMRGNIFGALGSRLGTAIHTGEFAGRPERRSPAGQSVIASAVLTLLLSVGLAVLAKETARLFGVQTMSFLDYLTVSVIGGVLSSIVVVVITLWVAALSVERGWDMDNVAAPVVTAAGDMVTLPALWLATLLLPLPYLPDLVGAASLVGLVLVTLYLLGARDLPASRRIVRESLPILLLAGLVDVVAGLTIDRRVEHFFVLPALLVLLPSFLADAGALGGILSARLSSKLHLGTIEPKVWPGRHSLEDITLIYLLALPVFLLIGVGATLASVVTGLGHPGLLEMMALTLVGGVLAITGAVLIGYYSAVLSYRFGLDPDNYGIPAITSTMDLVGVLALLASLVILGIVG